MEGRERADRGVYTWSVRWLDGELDRTKKAAAPLADHAKRMADLEAEATKRFNAGALSTADAQAAAYFRVEADLWVARGKR